MVKNPSTSPSQNYYLGPLSESVHEMDGLSPNSWSVVHMARWTDGRSADGRLRPRRPELNEEIHFGELNQRALIILINGLSERWTGIFF